MTLWSWVGDRLAAFRGSVWPAVEQVGGGDRLYPPDADAALTDDDRRIRSAAARAALQSPAIVQAFDRVERGVIYAWLDTPPTAAAEREALYARARALRDIRNDLMREARAGEPRSTPTATPRFASAMVRAQSGD